MESSCEADLIIRNIAAVGLDTSQHQSLVVRRQKRAIFRKCRDDWPTRDANQDRDATLNDEDPRGRKYRHH